MKPILTFALFILLIAVAISCQREISCVNCVDRNKAPLSLAGPDQAITLPTDSVSLDGSKSSDPDGRISAWLWTKISGPATFIIHPVSSKTGVKKLVMGVYKFELTVTDNGGLSAKDVVQF